MTKYDVLPKRALTLYKSVSVVKYMKYFIVNRLLVNLTLHNVIAIVTSIKLYNIIVLVLI